MTGSVCDGLVVLELGAGSVSASFSGMLLADNGARVLKVEPPEGDRLREQLPSGFLVWNRGKESVVADLRTEDGRAEVRRLAAAADVVLNGLSLDATRAWGLDDGDLRPGNPGLVYCQFSAFGPTGAYAGIKAYEGVVAAKAGLYWQGDFGFRHAPIVASAPLASIGAGHLGTGGVLAALLVRERTGLGQRVDASLAQGLVPLDYFGVAAMQYLQRQSGDSKPVSAAGAGATGASRVTFTMPAKDGRWILITQMLPHQAQALSRVLGLAHTIEDPRFAKQPFFATPEDAQEYENLIWEAFATRTYDEWEALLLADDNIAFEAAWTSEEGTRHPQIVHNGEVVEVTDERHGVVREVGPVCRFADSPAQVARSAPRLDAHGPLPERRTGSGGGAEPLPAHPLDGVTIVELGYFYAMPYGVTLAASLGARVIKLEGASGDPMRVSFIAPEVGSAKLLENKHSLALDLQQPAAQEIVHEVLRSADVFVCGFRPGVAERLRLGYDDLAGLNPRLVYVHATGYGSSGPYSHRPIYAWQAASVGGAFRRYAPHWLDPERVAGLPIEAIQAIVLPRIRSLADGDSNAAMAVFNTIMLGLYHQRRTGRGQFVSTTMIGGNALMYSDDFVTYEGKPPVPQVDEESWGLNALYRVYDAASRWVFLAAPTQAEWLRLTTALGRPELAGDPRFATPQARAEHDAELVTELAGVFATREPQEWETLLSAHDVGCGAVPEYNFAAFTCLDPVLREQGFTTETDHPTFGRILQAAPPVRLSATPPRPGNACVVGQHTREILHELGYADERVAELLRDGVAFAPDTP